MKVMPMTFSYGEDEMRLCHQSGADTEDVCMNGEEELVAQKFSLLKGKCALKNWASG